MYVQFRARACAELRRRRLRRHGDFAKCTPLIVSSDDVPMELMCSIPPALAPSQASPTNLSSSSPNSSLHLLHTASARRGNHALSTLDLPALSAATLPDHDPGMRTLRHPCHAFRNTVPSWHTQDARRHGCRPARADKYAHQRVWSPMQDSQSLFLVVRFNLGEICTIEHE